MARYDRSRWRVAGRLHECLIRRRQAAMCDVEMRITEHDHIGQACRRVRGIAMQMRRARQRGLSGAWAALQHKLRSGLASLQREAEVQLRALNEALVEPLPLGQILAEFASVEAEFSPGRITFTPDEVRVRTDRIELEDVDLGPFEIRLHIEDLAAPNGPSPLRVVALDPKPALGDPHITHPHVSGESLCAGDALISLKRALDEGRLSDMFMIVRSVLQTYNPRSAHVRLDEWEGEPCPDCGLAIADHDGNECAACGRDFCDECMARCESCDEPMCNLCLVTCNACTADTCRLCASRCSHCGHWACPDCTSDQLCRRCRTSSKENQHETDEHDEADEQPDEFTAPATVSSPASAG